AQACLDRRHTVRAQHHVLGHLRRDHSAGLHAEQISQFEFAAHHSGTQRHLGGGDLFTQGPYPALVMFVDIRLHAGIQHLTQRFDHRVRHGYVHLATAAIQFDMEGRDHHHLAGADDVRQRRVDLGVHILELHILDRLPGFLEIDEGLLQHHAHHAQLGGREFAPLDLGVAAVATEEVVHQLEHQPGIEDEQRGAPQRLHLHQVEAGGYIEGVYIFAELHHLHTADRYVRRAAQQVEHADAGIAGETLVDHFQRGHAPADDSVLTGQVVALDATRLNVLLVINDAFVHPVQQGIDFILGQQILNRHIVFPIAEPDW